jgi:Tripartite ATP-independent periplasmic transporter, DctM component
MNRIDTQDKTSPKPYAMTMRSGGAATRTWASAQLLKQGELAPLSRAMRGTTDLGQVFGIEPVHLGIIFLANMELGYLTPLVGLNLFFASYRFNKPLAEIFRAVLPLFLALAIGVLIITYVPWLSLWLPGLAPNR